MSIQTPHVYRGLNVRFDELTEPMTIVARKSTFEALEQLETGSEEQPKQRYQVKAKPKFVDGKFVEAKFGDDDKEVDSTHATKHEAVARERELKNAGYHTAIVEPTEAEDFPPSKGRYRVHSQITAFAPMLEESHWNTDGEAQARARELESKGLNTQIIDTSSGLVVPSVYPDGTSVAGPETPEHEWLRKEKEAKASQLPPHPLIANQPPDVVQA